MWTGSYVDDGCSIAFWNISGLSKIPEAEK